MLNAASSVKKDVGALIQAQNLLFICCLIRIIQAESKQVNSQAIRGCVRAATLYPTVGQGSCKLTSYGVVGEGLGKRQSSENIHCLTVTNTTLQTSEPNNPETSRPYKGQD